MRVCGSQRQSDSWTRRACDPIARPPGTMDAANGDQYVIDDGWDGRAASNRLCPRGCRQWTGAFSACKWGS